MEEYDFLITIITQNIDRFFRRRRVPPRFIYLGNYEWSVLIKGTDIIEHFDNEIYTVCGLKVIRVDKEEFLWLS